MIDYGRDDNWLDDGEDEPADCECELCGGSGGGPDPENVCPLCHGLG